MTTSRLLLFSSRELSIVTQTIRIPVLQDPCAVSALAKPQEMQWYGTRSNLCSCASQYELQVTPRLRAR